MDDRPDSFLSTLVFLLGDLWKLAAIAVAIVVGYVLLSMALGQGVEAWRDAIRRRRAAKGPEIESDPDN